MMKWQMLMMLNIVQASGNLPGACAFAYDTWHACTGQLG